MSIAMARFQTIFFKPSIFDNPDYAYEMINRDMTKITVTKEEVLDMFLKKEMKSDDIKTLTNGLATLLFLHPIITQAFAESDNKEGYFAYLDSIDSVKGIFDKYDFNMTEQEPIVEFFKGKMNCADKVFWFECANNGKMKYPPEHCLVHLSDCTRMLPSEPLLKTEAYMKGFLAFLMRFLNQYEGVRDEKMLQTMSSFIEDILYKDMEEDERKEAENPTFTFDRNDTKIKKECEEAVLGAEELAPIHSLIIDRFLLRYELDEGVMAYRDYVKAYTIDEEAARTSFYPDICAKYLAGVSGYDMTETCTFEKSKSGEVDKTHLMCIDPLDKVKATAELVEILKADSSITKLTLERLPMNNMSELLCSSSIEHLTLIGFLGSPNFTACMSGLKSLKLKTRKCEDKDCYIGKIDDINEYENEIRYEFDKDKDVDSYTFEVPGAQSSPVVIKLKFVDVYDMSFLSNLTSLESLELKGFFFDLKKFEVPSLTEINLEYYQYAALRSTLCEKDHIETFITPDSRFNRAQFEYQYCGASNPLGVDFLDDLLDILKDPDTLLLLLTKYFKLYGGYVVTLLVLTIVLVLVLLFKRAKSEIPTDKYNYFRMAGQMKTEEHIRLVTKNKILNEFLVKKLKERKDKLVSEENDEAEKAEITEKTVEVCVDSWYAEMERIFYRLKTEREKVCKKQVKKMKSKIEDLDGSTPFIDPDHYYKVNDKMRSYLKKIEKTKTLSECIEIRKS